MFDTSLPSAFTNGWPSSSQTSTNYRGYPQEIYVSIAPQRRERWVELPERDAESLEDFHEHVEQDRLYRAQLAFERILAEQTRLRRARPRLLLSASRPRVPVVQLTRSRGQAPRATR
jgi:hypothetical protein